jgi:hypothetical protein
MKSTVDELLEYKKTVEKELANMKLQQSGKVCIIIVIIPRSEGEEDILFYPCVSVCKNFFQQLLIADASNFSTLCFGISYGTIHFTNPMSTSC